jgi:threonine-phosphate decarboxylase
MLEGHGGNIYATAQRFGHPLENIIDMSSNINPLGPPPGLLDFLKCNLSRVTRLPEVDSQETLKAFAGFLQMDPDRMLAGNGTTQFIYQLPSVLDIRKALIIGPTYSDYGDACKMHRVPASMVIASEAASFQPDIGHIEKSLESADTVFVCNPNNPTGALILKHDLQEICRAHPKTRFVVDESYLPFIKGGEVESMMKANLENVIVLFSISKIFAVPGLRIGFVAGNIAAIREFRRFLLPWSVNCLAHTAVQYLVENKNAIQAFVQKTRNFIQDQREEFDRSLRNISAIKLYPSATPFLLARLPQAVSAESAWASLAREKILIRNCSNFPGLSDRFIRLSLKSREANQLLTEKLSVMVTGSNRFSQTSPKKQNTGV